MVEKSQINFFFVVVAGSQADLVSQARPFPFHRSLIGAAEWKGSGLRDYNSGGFRGGKGGANAPPFGG